MNSRSCLHRSVIASGLLALANLAFPQGSLTPPGAPAPTMKTLAQIEPRSPISTLPTNITTAGSYYLTANLTGGVGNGISVGADNVTIDLNGFALIGGTGSGIAVPAAQKNLRVFNGTVRGWGQSGIDAANAANSSFQRLCLFTNAQFGVIGGNSCSVTDCSASTNGAGGIIVGSYSKITDCTATYSISGEGFSLGNGSIANRCVAGRNAHGFSATADCQITDCIASFNSSGGISLGTAALARRCTVGQNTGDGINGGDDCVIAENHCTFNTIGIHVTGNYNRIEGNALADNTSRGIKVDIGNGNLVIRNVVNGGGTNSFNIPTNNLVGPIIGTATGMLTNNNPHANYAY